MGEFGTFAGTLQVPADAGTGVFRLEASVDERKHQAEARVQDYVKPTFYVEVLAASETITPGDTLKAKMMRLDLTDPNHPRFDEKDSFELTAKAK